MNHCVSAETHTETCLNRISPCGPAVAGGSGPFFLFLLLSVNNLVFRCRGDSRINLLGSLLFSFLDGVNNEHISQLK